MWDAASDEEVFGAEVWGALAAVTRRTVVVCDMCLITGTINRGC